MKSYEAAEKKRYSYFLLNLLYMKLKESFSVQYTFKYFPVNIFLLLNMFAYTKIHKYMLLVFCSRRLNIRKSSLWILF